jgi:hypothetical protein
VYRLLAPTPLQSTNLSGFSVTQIAGVFASLCIQVVYGEVAFTRTTTVLRHRVGSPQVASRARSGAAYAAENTHSTLCGNATARPAVRGSTWTCA